MAQTIGVWKKWFCLAAVFGLLFMAAGEVLASGQEATVSVEDTAALLMEEEADWLKDTANQLAQKSGWDVVALTCGDAGGQTAQAVCEEAFRTYASGKDGICCLADTDNGEIVLKAFGSSGRYLDDERVSRILEEAGAPFLEQDYTQCLYLMLLRSDEAYETGMTEGAAADWKTPETKMPGMLLLLTVVLLALAAMAARARRGR